VSDVEPTAPVPVVEEPVDPLFSHAASPFLRTNPPQEVAFPGPPLPAVVPMSTWTTYKTQIQFGFALLAYLMVLVGVVTVVSANPVVSWRFIVAALPVIPAGLVIWLIVRALSRLDELQKRMQMQALGFSLAATGLFTFGYGFMEGAALPHLSPVFVLPLMTLFWGLGVGVLALQHRLRK